MKKINSHMSVSKLLKLNKPSFRWASPGTLFAHSPLFQMNVRGFHQKPFNNETPDTELSFLVDTIKPSREANDYNQYMKVVDMAGKLKKVFDASKFKYVMDYLQNNQQIQNQALIKSLEQIFVRNLNCLESTAKSEFVLFFSRQYQGNITSLKADDELGWLALLDDFESQKSMRFEAYYNYICAFSKMAGLFTSLKAGAEVTSEFAGKHSKFMAHDNAHMLNTSAVISGASDLILLSKLIQAQIVQFSHVSDFTWRHINFLVWSEGQLNLKLGLVLPALLIIHYESSPSKTKVLFMETVAKLNDYVFFLYSNFELLDAEERESLEKFADTILFYSFIFMERDKFDQICPGIVHAYHLSIKGREERNWVNEMKILLILAKEVGCADKDFWTDICLLLNEFITNDFHSTMKDLFPSKRKKLIEAKSTGKSKKYQASDETSITSIFYVGLLIEVFSAVKFTQASSWHLTTQLLAGLKVLESKDIFFNLQFISIHCASLYSDPLLFENVWLGIIPIFNPKLQRFLYDRQVIEFIVDCTFSSVPRADTKKLVACLKSLFPRIDSLSKTWARPAKSALRSEARKVTDLEAFFTFVELVAETVFEQPKHMKILVHTFVDIVKTENSLFVGSKLKKLLSNIKVNTDHISELREVLFNRVKSLLEACETEQETSELNKVLLVLTQSEIFNEFDLHMLVQHLKSSEKLNNTNLCIIERFMKSKRT